MPTLRLGVNIDHVATLRNARGGVHPCPVAAALLAEKAGADGITAHLREDRRHIRDADIRGLKAAIGIPLNLEMAATEAMVAMALKTKPDACCIVPERRQEVTTEGGLDVQGRKAALMPVVNSLRDAGIRVSLFIDADDVQVRAAKDIGAPVVEFHTGHYAEVAGSSQGLDALSRIRSAVALAHSLGLECHAGHGLTYGNVGAIAAIPDIVELNIGHFLIGQAVFDGLPAAITEMRRRIHSSRFKNWNDSLPHRGRDGEGA